MIEARWHVCQKIHRKGTAADRGRSALYHWWSSKRKYICTNWNCKFKICLEYSYSYPILHSLQALIGACWLPLLACWLSCWFVGFLRSHFGSSVLSTADRPFTVSTSSKMDDTPKQMCKASRTILQQLTHVLQEEVVKSLQHWTYMSWRLIASLQMEARSQLVQALKKRPDLSHWRSIVEKLNRKYLYKPFQIIYRQKRQVQYHHQV